MTTIDLDPATLDITEPSLRPKPGYYFSPVADQLAIIYPNGRVELIWRSEGAQHTRMTTYRFMRSIVTKWEYMGGL